VRNCDDPFVSSGIEHTQTLCADLIDSYINTSAKNLQVDNHCSIMKDHCYALTDISNTLHANNVDHVKLLTHAEFFTRTSPTECVCYVMLDEFVEIDKMLENVLDISFMKSFNSAYGCRFTFNIIGHHAVNQFNVCALCITWDKFAELKLNRMSSTSCEPYFSKIEMNRLFNAYCSKLPMLFHCSYFSSKERNLVQTCSIHSPKVFPSTSGTMEFERYISKHLNTLCHMNLYNAMNVSLPSFDMIDLSMMKHDNMNKISGLEEIFVLPFSKLISGSQNLRNYFSHQKRNNVHMNCEEGNEQSSISDHSNWHLDPLSIFFRLFSGEQKPKMAFLEVREDDMTMPRTSTFTLNSKHPFKVKAKLDSKSFWFPPTRLLLGLYDYRFKHLAVMEEEECNRNIASSLVGLAQLLGLDGLESRVTPFQEGGG